MKEPVWVEKEALLLLHSRALSRFGGSEGIRDEGLLDSALARPQNAYAYGQADSLTALAASYAFGLAKNHAFVDGNKRAAFMACILFLDLNGVQLTAPQAEAITAMTALADGTMGEPVFAAWLEANV